MKEETIQRLAKEIADVAEACGFCPLNEECEGLLCAKAWYEHICKLEVRDRDRKC